MNQDVHIYTTADRASTYKATVGIGSPPVFYTLIVDTGSANTWIGARRSRPYKKTRTSRETGQALIVRYGTGEFREYLFFDRLTLGGLVIGEQGIGVAESVWGFDEGVDGILGLGPAELTKESMGDCPDGGLESIPTVTDNLFAQGKIQERCVALAFESMAAVLESNESSGIFDGVVIFGGVDTSRCSGEIAMEQKIAYGSAADGGPILQKSAGVIDTGSPLIHLASDAFRGYKRATGAVLDDATGLLRLTKEQSKSLKSLFFEIGGTSFEFPPCAQMWPQVLNDVAGGPDSEDAVYLVFAELARGHVEGVEFINGFMWLQQFYTVLDAEKGRVGVGRAKKSDRDGQQY